MPEEIDDFEEFEVENTPNLNIKNKTQNSTKKDNILDFNKERQKIKSRNNDSSQNIPKQNIGQMPQNNPNVNNKNIEQGNGRSLPFKKNLEEKNNKKSPKKNEKSNVSKNDKKMPNTQKKDNILPFGKGKKSNDKENNSLKDKLNKKRPFPQIGRKKKKEEDKNDNKKENDSQEEKSKDNKSNSKNDGTKSKLDKIKNPGQAIKNKVKNAVQAAVNKVLRPIKIKIILVISALVTGLFLCFVTVYLVLSLLIDIWPYVDETARTAANYTEKFLNFYRGFGFVDSKEAFYDEANALNKFYDNKLDMPLLLSTLFYPETQDYDMTYEDHLAVDNGDPITSFLSGGPTGFVSFMKNWIKDAFLGEARNTYDENGLVYNANKIYRLRRLAAAMADRDGPTKTVNLGEFLKMLGDKFYKAFKDLIGSVLGFAVDLLQDTFTLVINELLDLVTLDFDAMAEDFKSFFENIKSSGGNVAYAISQLINVMSFGVCSIVDISFHPIKGIIEGVFSDSSNEERMGLVTITYKEFKYNKDKYDDYLLDYYFENTMEYAKMLPGDSEARTAKKRQILSEIYTNKEAFEQIFLDYKEGTAEEYVNNCEGAIPNKIVRNLSLPVKSDTFNFSQNDLFGIKNGYKQNGVLITQSNSGITAGSEVYSVYDGTVLKIGKMDEASSSTSTETSELTDDSNNYVTIQHEMIFDNNITSQSTRETFYTTYEYLSSVSSSLSEGAHVSKGEVIGIVGTVDSSNNGNLIGDTTVERVWWALLKAGYSKEATAGIIGNMAIESGGHTLDGIKSNSIECGGTFEGMLASGCGFGLVGWTTSSFKTTFPEYMKSVGGNWDDDEVQIGYLIETLSSNNRWNTRFYNKWTNYTYDKFVNASTPEIAAEQFCRIYEKGPKYEYNSERSTFAREAYNRFKDKVMPVSNISTSGVNKQPGFYFEFKNKNNTPINPNNLFIKCAGAYGDYIWPGSNGHISDLFGDRSYEVRNGLGNYGSCATTAHVALDINEKGAFYAIGSGTIDSISTTGVHTIEFKLDDTDMDGNEIYIVYTHGDAKKGLKKGQHLEQGEQIGTANGWGYNKQGVNTASAYGVHLHFGVYTKTSSGRLYHNPLTYLYNLSYDSSNDWKMSVNIPKYDGTILSEITFWNIRPEERNFAADFATVGNYNSNKCDYENPKFWKTTINN